MLCRSQVDLDVGEVHEEDRRRIPNGDCHDHQAVLWINTAVQPSKSNPAVGRRGECDPLKMAIPSFESSMA